MHGHKTELSHRFVMALLLAVLGLSGCSLSSGGAIGARATGARLARMKASPQWNPEQSTFKNTLRRMRSPRSERNRAIFSGGSKHRRPAPESPIETQSGPDFSSFPDSGLRITWMGHSTFLVELDGTRTLVDPIWSERASPFQWLGPQRFYPPPIPLHTLPTLDAILISHDHYDHLDYHTVLALAEAEVKWIVPLGVGAHLEHWGIAPDMIFELDWWQHLDVGDVTITATPSRHFSGRAITLGDQDATLWAGWAWQGPRHSVFYSGDTALHPEFQTIGERLGPFDVTLMEVGAYSRFWRDVHLGPEQAVLAHQLVQGDVMIPVHWGLFNMSLHGWTEPVERVLLAAQRVGVEVAILRPGASFVGGNPAIVDRWWPNVPWKSPAQSPAWSSQVEALQAPLRRPQSRGLNGSPQPNKP